MSLPEISRRCLSCGAAVRVGSRFCQQCGKGLEAEAASSSVTDEREEARPPAPPTGEWARPAEEAPKAKDWAPPTKEFAAFEQSQDVVEPQAATAEPEVPVAAAHAGAEVEPEEPAVVLQESRAEAVQAADDAGEVGEPERAGDLRGRVARVREGTRARVGRMREEAIVVLEETPDDSGLRFVLAAAALFILSLVLLFLSTTLLH